MMSRHRALRWITLSITRQSDHIVRDNIIHESAAVKVRVSRAGDGSFGLQPIIWGMSTAENMQTYIDKTTAAMPMFEDIQQHTGRGEQPSYQHLRGHSLRHEQHRASCGREPRHQIILLWGCNPFRIIIWWLGAHPSMRELICTTSSVDFDGIASRRRPRHGGL